MIDPTLPKHTQAKDPQNCQVYKEHNEWKQDVRDLLSKVQSASEASSDDEPPKYEDAIHAPTNADRQEAEAARFRTALFDFVVHGQVCPCTNVVYQ